MYPASMVSSRSRLCTAFALSLALTGILSAGHALMAADRPAVSEALAKDSLQQKWEDGLVALSTGRFKQAFSLIHEVARQSDGNERVRLVDQWISSFEKLQRERSERAQKDYETYVAWAKADMAQEKWRSAIRAAGMAFNAAADQDAFRAEPWLLKVVEGAQAAAQEYEENAKWLQAERIYVRLVDIFPRRKEFKEALDRCQAHIRLEFTYSPESDWEAAVAHITPDMAIDAFNKIATEYITEPNFKEAAVAALKHVLLMTQENKIARVFKRLEDVQAVDEFRDRINVRLRMAQEREELTHNDLINHFKRVLTLNRETQLFPQTVLIHEFVHGALKPLDPFSDMLWPADLQEFNKHTQGRFSGVGISIHKDPGEPIRVVSPLEDTPAYNADIRPGDLITAINGQPSKKLSITAAVREITGPPGTTVTLTIKRPGVEKEFDVRLERREITIFTIKGFERDEAGRWKYMIDPANGIAYLRMTNFTEGTIDELKEIVRRLRQDEGMRGLIFDLRGNPGGPLKAAVDVSDLFLEGRKKIVATKDRHDKPWEMSSSSGSAGHFPDFPMIILVNGSSASASEIVAGALQVHGRALIVGERSFGKGSVQQVLRLGTNPAYLKLTTAKYYLPNGRCLHRDEDSVTWGVDPDVEVKLVPKEIVKVAELRVSNDVLKGKNQKNLTKDYLKSITSLKPTTKPADDQDGEENGDEEDLEEDEWFDSERNDPNEYPEIDPQLETAMVLMRVRLATERPWPTRAAEVAVAAPKERATPN
ncbi:MAG: S41 family peptidase [Phycisphaerae bacterium]